MNKVQATPQNMQDILSRKPRGLHFSGHGEREALIFEDSNCGMLRFDQDNLETML
jgi:hypothetical protein